MYKRAYHALLANNRQQVAILAPQISELEQNPSFIDFLPTRTARLKNITGLVQSIENDLNELKEIVSELLGE